MQQKNLAHTHAQFNTSCDLYNLLLSRTNWYEELQNGNIIGLLLHIITPKLAKLGIVMDKIKIIEISNNLITFENLCEAQDIYITTKKEYDNGRSDSFAIYGNALGNGNCILPLYINQLHWNLVKPQLNYTMGIAINQNPFDYYNKHLEIYPMTLLKLVQNMISDRNKITDKDIITFIQLSITTNIVFKEYFNLSINKKSLDECSILFNDPFNRTEQYFDNLDCLLGFTILSTDKIISKKINTFKQNNLKNIFVEQLRRCLKHSHANHNPFTFDENNIDIAKLWHSFTSLAIENNTSSYLNIIINILKYKYDKKSENHNMPIIFKQLFNNDVIESINKIIIWSLLSDINNNETIDHLTNVKNNKYGFIDVETIKYFKNIFVNFNIRYKIFENNDNKLLFLDINDHYELRQHTLILQNIVTRDKKYFLQNYMFNPLADSLDSLSTYYTILTKPFINCYFNNLSYHTANLDDQYKYIDGILDVANNYIDVLSNESNKLLSHFNSFYDDNLISTQLKKNTHDIIVQNNIYVKNNLKNIIVESVSYNLDNEPKLLEYFKQKI